MFASFVALITSIGGICGIDADIIAIHVDDNDSLHDILILIETGNNIYELKDNLNLTNWDYEHGKERFASVSSVLRGKRPFSWFFTQLS